tara:strand:- start:407 stop:616 length:210 start_codon:yes stop_codon:yes gene_type:complete
LGNALFEFDTSNCIGGGIMKVPRKIVLTVLGFVAFLSIVLLVVSVSGVWQEAEPDYSPPDPPAVLEMEE